MFQESVFVLPVWSKGPSATEGSEFGEKTVRWPGSYFGEKTGSNPGSDGLEEDHVPSVKKNVFGVVF